MRNISKWLFISLLSVIILIAITLLHSRINKKYTSQGLVHIQKDNKGFSLIRNGKPFYIQGAGGTSEYKKLAEFGGNTIRTWDTTRLETILDSARINNLAVMVTLPMLPSRYLDFYEDEKKVSHQYLIFSGIVKKYKNHPSLLFWILGNELDFPYRPKYNRFYKTYNNLLKMIHREDPNHPVTTTLTNFSRRAVINLKFKVPELDVISINSFGGKIKELRKEIQDFEWFWDGPFIITEWGINGPWGSEKTIWNAPLENSGRKKAEQLEQLYTQHIPFENLRLLGTLAFYWGSKQERTHTWFSLLDENGAISKSARVLRNLWSNSKIENDFPELDYILVDNRGDHENLIFEPGKIKITEAIFEQDTNDTLIYKWEINHEDWFYTRFGKERSPSVNGQAIKSETGKIATFVTPEEEGPYRIFLTIYDYYGHFVTANAPFYVVANPHERQSNN